MESALGGKLPASLYTDKLVASVKKLAFYSEGVREKVPAVPADATVQVSRHRHQEPRGAPGPERGQARQGRPPRLQQLDAGAEEGRLRWVSLTADKSDYDRYQHFMFYGPYKELLGGKLDCIYKGIYRKGIKDIWGYLVAAS